MDIIAAYRQVGTYRGAGAVCGTAHKTVKRVIEPSLRPAIGKPAATRKVDRLSCVRFGSARYSLPTRLISQHVAVTESGGCLLIADTATGEIAGAQLLFRFRRRLHSPSAVQQPR
jgi:Mu transposase, C-terminal domain